MPTVKINDTPLTLTASVPQDDAWDVHDNFGSWIGTVAKVNSKLWTGQPKLKNALATPCKTRKEALEHVLTEWERVHSFKLPDGFPEAMERVGQAAQATGDALTRLARGIRGTTKAERRVLSGAVQPCVTVGKRHHAFVMPNERSRDRNAGLVTA